ncbi:MAG: Mycolic acid cyclopropane synthetase-domain-containing protein [Linnemannia elongata]|nr:MAG: Mycolic acid cyclopropane synthetase-domain-containing protein [Linnemannia elongata]
MATSVKPGATWKKTNYPSIKNPDFPVEVAGFETFNNFHLASVILGAPFILVSVLKLPLWSYPVLTILLALPIFAAYFTYGSQFALPINNRVQTPGKKVEDYITIVDPAFQKYKGKNRIPMETFFEAYFDGKIDINQDCLELLENRHDWTVFHMTASQAKFFVTQWIPETLWHSKKQDEDQVRDHYDRGDDFYAAFLGPRMIYTSGIMADVTKKETLEEMQDNKLKLVCEKIQLKKGERHLDIGCGWGTLTAYAAKNYGTDSTGITLGLNQTAFGNNRIKEYGVPATQARIKCMDYRDIPREKWDKITCLEMAEHVGIRKFNEFLLQVKDMLNDDGLFFLQIAGLRAAWQYEDFIWGLFMAKYVFPGADASMPLYWVIKQLECAGFEVQNVDTIGVHYSATIHRWYLNWMSNKESITATYGKKWFRTWEIFLAWSTIISRQGSATCYQIVAHKNLNAFDRTSLQAKNRFSA